MTSMNILKDSSILIIGAGTFGLSSALSLARTGFSNITCFDKYPVPSSIAAGNDSNKIFDYNYIGPDEEPSPSERLDLEAGEAWKNDPVFKDHYHPVGLIMSSCSEEPLRSESERYLDLKRKGHRDYEYLDTPEKFRKHIPVLTGDLPRWRGYLLDKDNGWLHARNSLISAYKECLRLGVKFVFGADGEIVDLITSGDNIMGIKSKSGQISRADKFILSAGANAVTVLNFKNQLEGKCFTLVHIKVTDREAKKFVGLPVIFNNEKGFFFEADENNEIKICNEFPGYTNMNENGESIPLYRMEIPSEAAQEVRQYLRETMPEFSDRPFVKTRICWCTDSPDRELIICTHPDYDNLVIASGDSGKSFMLMPIIGKYISKVAIYGDEGLDPADRELWRWRPETSDSRDNQQDRWGGSGVVKDIKSLKQWVSVENPEPHDISWD